MASAILEILLILSVTFLILRLLALERAVANPARILNKPRRRDTRSPVRGAELLTKAIRAA